MNNQDLSNYSVAYSPNNFSTEHLSPAAKQQIHNDASLVVREVIKRNLVENGLAMIQSTALKNVGDLSLLEQQLSELAPHSAERLKFLVDQYTLRANQRLER